MTTKTEFDKMAGKWHDFYGVDNNRFKIGNRIFEAIENEEDGYRSCLGSVERKDGEGIFFPHPVARVKIEAFNDPEMDYDGIQGYRLVDKSHHTWLIFGTGNYNDYYPYFVFRYSPKEKK